MSPKVDCQCPECRWDVICEVLESCKKFRKVKCENCNHVFSTDSWLPSIENADAEEEDYQGTTWENAGAVKDAPQGNVTWEQEDPDYESLRYVLDMAYEQASAGKGAERHANGLPFEEQPIMQIARGHGLGFLTGQAVKKLQESHTLLSIKGKDAAVRELLGAINYAAAAVLLAEEQNENTEEK